MYMPWKGALLAITLASVLMPQALATDTSDDDEPGCINVSTVTWASGLLGARVIDGDAIGLQVFSGLPDDGLALLVLIVPAACTGTDEVFPALGGIGSVPGTPSSIGGQQTGAPELPLIP